MREKGLRHVPYVPGPPPSGANGTKMNVEFSFCWQVDQQLTIKEAGMVKRPGTMLMIWFPSPNQPTVRRASTPIFRTALLLCKPPTQGKGVWHDGGRHTASLLLLEECVFRLALIPFVCVCVCVERYCVEWIMPFTSRVWSCFFLLLCTRKRTGKNVPFYFYFIIQAFANVPPTEAHTAICLHPRVGVCVCV